MEDWSASVLLAVDVEKLLTDGNIGLITLPRYRAK